MSSTWITRVADTKTKTRDSCIVVFVYSLGSIMHAVVFKFLNTLIRCRVIHTNLQAVSAMHSSLKWYSRPIQSLVSLYFVPGKGCEVCDELPVNVSIHLSVCPLAQLENHTADLRQIFVHVAYRYGSDLLWQRCGTLCTSGFVDDTLFSHSGASCVLVCKPICKGGRIQRLHGPNFHPSSPGGSTPPFSTARRPSDGVAHPWNGVLDSNLGLPTNERRERTDFP